MTAPSILALDDLYADISTARARHAEEPLSESDEGYVKLLFAYGYHQLQSAPRAFELEAAGRALLETHREDPVHAWLIDAFEARCREAPETHHARRVLPAALRARLDAFDRVTRYEIDRFCEASWIVGGGEVDAIGRFAGGGEPASTSSFVERVEHALALSEAAEEPDAADAFVEGALQVRSETLEPEAAVGVLDRVLPRIERMAGRRGLAYARAIALAAHAAPDRVATLSEQVVPFIACEPWNVDEILALLSRSLAPNHRVELAELWERMPESARVTPMYRLGQLRLGAPPEQTDLTLAASHDPFTHELRAATLEAFLARPSPGRFAGRWAGELFARIHDDLATSTHFTYDVIFAVDRLVRGALAA